MNEYVLLPNGCEAHWEVVERILFIYAKLNPGIAYVQGMNEIVGPLYYTFATDPSSEWRGKQVGSWPLTFVLAASWRNRPRKAGLMGLSSSCAAPFSVLGLHSLSVG